MDFSAIIPALPGLWDGLLMTLQLMLLGVLMAASALFEMRRR